MTRREWDDGRPLTDLERRTFWSALIVVASIICYVVMVVSWIVS